MLSCKPMYDDLKKIKIVAKALSDETRIRMLKLLTEKDICICEMEEIFPLSKSQISRNLKMLMESGFLKRWNEGKCVVYVADPASTNLYCRTLLEMLSGSLSKLELIIQDRQKLQKVIDNKVRELRK